MTKLFLRIYDYFHGHKVLLWSFLIVSSLLMGWGASQLRLENNITSFLPNSKDSENALVFGSLKIKDCIVIMLTAKDESVNADALVDAADIFSDALWERTDTNHILRFATMVNLSVADNSIDYIYEHLPFYMDNEDYERLDSLLDTNKCKTKLEEDYETLLSPFGVAMQSIIMRDPLGIGTKKISQLNDFNQFSEYTIYDQRLFSDDLKTLFMFIDSRDGSNASPLNDELTIAIEDALKVVENTNSNIKGECSGVGIVAVYNMRQIQKDLMITVNVAIVIIIILILLAFRRKRTIPLLIAPVLYGILFAMAAIYLIQGTISAIALGTGAVVLGVALSYSIHVICHASHSKSVRQIIEELSYPLTVGSITTIGAFIGLQFTSSPLLQDFGLFAACSLIGTIFFCLIFLPHFLVVDPDQTKKSFMRFLNKVNAYPYDRNRWLVALIMIILLISLFFCNDVKFDYDMMKLYSEPAHLLQAREHLEQFAGEDGSDILLSHASSSDVAIQEYRQTQNAIRKDITEGHVEKLMSAADFLLSQQEQQQRLAKWNTFWTPEKIAAVQKQINTLASEVGFSDGAFADFYQILGKHYHPGDMIAEIGDREMVFSSFIEEHDNNTLLLTQLWLPQENKSIVYPHISHTASIVDRSYFIAEMAKQINDDFNLILWISSLLIFGVLLISYGSIEMALLAFLPMFFSWFIILGIMAIFGIKFNIVNIILSSFIFGIGDDFSIFVLDGLHSEYREGKQILPSHKTAIFFSALMTIIGMGVLLFAKNPAIHSLALVSLLGILVVVAVSYTIQPLLWRFLVTTQTNKGGMPHTLISLSRSIIVFLAVLLCCLLLDLSTPFLLLLPCSMKQKRALFRKFLAWVSPFPIWVAAGLHLKINRNGETFDKPSFIIANHQSMIDLLIMFQLTDKAIVVVRDWIWKNPLFFLIARFAGFINVSEGYETIERKLEKAFADGLSVIVFPEGTRSETWEIQRFRKGTFYFAQKFHRDIIPIVMYGTGHGYPKGQLYIADGQMVVNIHPHIRPDDLTYGETYQQRAKNIREYLINLYDKMCERYDNMDNIYFRTAFRKAFIYKDIRIQYRVIIKALKNKYYRTLDAQTPRQGTIVVTHCGYGDVPYALAIVAKHRQVIAIDTDEDRINYAKHLITKHNNLTCIHVREYQDFQIPAGAYVIHLNEEK